MVLNKSKLKVSRIFHAGYIFESDTTKIAFDPLFENPFSFNCFVYPEISIDVAVLSKTSANLKFDAIFISHVHDDHFSMKSLNLIDRAAPIYIFSINDEARALLLELGFTDVHLLKLNEAVQIGDLKIRQWPALDVDVDSLFQIQFENLNILNVVDSWIDWETCDQLQKAGPWDLVLWPFQTMREIPALSPRLAGPADEQIPEEWLEQIQKLAPKNIVASSCQFRFEKGSWLNHFFFPISYKSFAHSMSEIGIQSWNLLPGETYCLESDSFTKVSRLSFLHLNEDLKDFEYDYQPQMKVPNLDECLELFEKLSPAQAFELEAFLEKIPSLNLTDYFERSDFFQTPRTWCLRVIFSTDRQKKFYFRIQGGRFIPIELSTEPQSYDWLTEILAVKLWGASVKGESLSSLYLRINDEQNVYDENKKDPMEDPLLGLLYGQESFSYQKAQLRELKSSLLNKF